MPNAKVTAADLKGKRNKYSVADKSERMYRGVVYHSKLEATTAAYLELIANGRELRRQVNFCLRVGETIVANYKADFVFSNPGEVYEAKGCMTEAARIKLKLFHELYPDWVLYLVTDAGKGKIHMELYK